MRVTVQTLLVWLVSAPVWAQTLIGDVPQEVRDEIVALFVQGVTVYDASDRFLTREEPVLAEHVRSISNNGGVFEVTVIVNDRYGGTFTLRKKCSVQSGICHWVTQDRLGRGYFNDRIEPLERMEAPQPPPTDSGFQ